MWLCIGPTEVKERQGLLISREYRQTHQGWMDQLFNNLVWGRFKLHRPPKGEIKLYILNKAWDSKP